MKYAAGFIDLARADVAQLDGVHVGVGGEQPHVERARHAQQLAADAARAHHAQRAPGQAHAHVVHPLVPPPGAREAVLQHQLAGEREDERQRDRRHRTRHRPRRVRDDDAGARHGRHVHRVVADPVPRDDAQPAIRAGHRRAGTAHHVDVQRVVAGGVIGADFGDDRRQVFPLDAGRSVEDRQRRLAEGRLPARVEDVAGDADAELRGHGTLPGQLRKRSSPRRSALPSIAWSSP
jgi:hypothetical protein